VLFFQETYPFGHNFKIPLSALCVCRIVSFFMSFFG